VIFNHDLLPLTFFAIAVAEPVNLKAAVLVAS
jgi:hypothetical protein